MKGRLTTEEYVKGILDGDRIILSQAITLVESIHEKHSVQAKDIVKKILPHSGNSIRIGITGVPGVGKSTFIEALGSYVVEQEERKLAVLAIDPSSTQSKGSILGDKTRMELLSNHPKAYIRPSPTSGSLGGVSRKTRETILLCEAAGFDTIFVETVGVGQSEIAVHSMTDFFLLLMLAGAGDELQGIKKGIMEMADAIVINKADGDNEKTAKKAQAAYKSALHLFPPKESTWTPPVITSSALYKKGIDEIWSIILQFGQKLRNNGYLEQNRKQQNLYWFREHIGFLLLDKFQSNNHIKKRLTEIEQQITTSKINPFEAAENLVGKFLENRDI